MGKNLYSVSKFLSDLESELVKAREHLWEYIGLTYSSQPSLQVAF